MSARLRRLLLPFARVHAYAQPNGYTHYAQIGPWCVGFRSADGWMVDW